MESQTRAATRRRIHQAFLDLISEDGITNITVGAVAKRAEINRSTFYTYYQDIPALLSKVEDDILEELACNFQTSGVRGHDISLDFTLTFEILTHYGDALFTLLGPGGDPAFLSRFIDLAKPYFMRSYKLDQMSGPSDILFCFEMMGSLGVFTIWRQGGKQYPLEDVIRILQKTLRSIGSVSLSDLSGTDKEPVLSANL